VFAARDGIFAVLLALSGGRRIRASYPSDNDAAFHRESFVRNGWRGITSTWRGRR
jgi:hypothetical protein